MCNYMIIYNWVNKMKKYYDNQIFIDYNLEENENNRRKLVRVNVNLPEDIVNFVRDFSSENGLTYSNGYTYLLSYARQQLEIYKSMPTMINNLSEILKKVDLTNNSDSNS